MWSASDPRPLYTVLTYLAWFEPGLVLVRGRDYGKAEMLAQKARRDAKSERDPEARRFVTAPEFWLETDRDRKVLVMWNTPRGPEPFMAEVGSETYVPVADERTGDSGLHGASLGKSHACAAPQVRFDRKCFQPGAHYGWDDLTPEMKRDVGRQRDEVEPVHGRPVENLTYRFIVIPHRELVAILAERFGPNPMQIAKSADVRKIARSIEREGLRSPPIGEEGWKRALALASLGMDMPYVSILPPFEMGPYPFVALEGGALG